MKDFRGNDIEVGDKIVYAPISSSGLVEAEVLEIKSRTYFGGRVRTEVRAKPLRWTNSWRSGRSVWLTNMHLLMRVDASK